MSYDEISKHFIKVGVMSPDYQAYASRFDLESDDLYGQFVNYETKWDAVVGLGFRDDEGMDVGIRIMIDMAEDGEETVCSSKAILNNLEEPTADEEVFGYDILEEKVVEL